MWYVYLVLPMSGMFILYYAIDDILRLKKVENELRMS